MRTITIGISGSSSAGKTTLTALLSRIFSSANSSSPKILMIHADDFNKEFEDLPRLEDGTLDADSVDSVYFDRLTSCLRDAIATGESPKDYEIHDFVMADLARAARKFDDSFVMDMRAILFSSASKIRWDTIKAIVVLDGFLLFHATSPVRQLFDIALFLRTSEETARVRRFGRYGEGAAPEGSEEFWKTESYFEKCVWKNYVKEHGYLFPRGDVEAVVDSKVMMEHYGIWTTAEVDMVIGESSKWAVERLKEELERLSRDADV